MALRYNANLEVQYPEKSLLGQVSAPTRKAFENAWTEYRYSPGKLILDTEEESNDVIILLEGSVRVASFSARGREVSFSTLSEGACFGEFSVIDGAPRSASVMALTECRVGRIAENQFRRLLETHQDVSMALLKSLVAKLRELTRRVNDFTALKADDRIRLEIIRLAKEAMVSDQEAMITDSPTQADLAAFVFTNREAVAREIGRMKKKGLIERRGRGMYVPSVKALEKYQVELQGD
jgi:CRP/FNR family transcriptional regulator, cyclic AMP receptor protein